ncbi:hypothetical protein [Variovorax sp. PAMC 28711]|uniref:hypothetical protein n=1 Tax=Variovorax sp. PAMC 28711 TaxID=1795631 RepID=UPI00078CC385|nr:hypothetical protein [Variovorax sp. PAMC 28711]AMM26865.1 hypothetical protein AX767_17960 [Variovorax sp. PAMC 28711]
MNPLFSRAALCAALLFLFAGAVSAADGHDHDAPAASGGPALPRFTAVSETFEMVGVLNGMQLTMYLDRFADNSPVKDAQLSLEIDGAGVKVEPHGEGEFEAVLAQVPTAGVLSITATVVAGNESDLLAGELDIHEAAHADAVAKPLWQRIALWGFGAVAAVVIAALFAAFIRRTSTARRSCVGGAA